MCIPTCPECNATVYRLNYLPADEAPEQNSLMCGRCAAHIRPLTPRGAPGAVFQDAPANAMPTDQEAPPDDWWFLGCVLLDGGGWRPAALCRTAERCFMALAYYPGRPDVLVFPCEPPPREEEADGREEWTLTFRVMADPDGVPPGVRFRHLLKHAKRRQYLECVRINGDREAPKE